MDLKLKIVSGSNPNERMKSVDGLINALDRELKKKTPDERLVQEVNDLKQTITVLLDFLGLAVGSGPKKIIRRVRLIEDAPNTNNPL